MFYQLVIHHADSEIGPHFDMPFDAVESVGEIGEQIASLYNECGIKPSDVLGAYVLAGDSADQCYWQYERILAGMPVLGAVVNRNTLEFTMRGGGNPWAGIAKESTPGTAPAGTPSDEVLERLRRKYAGQDLANRMVRKWGDE